MVCGIDTNILALDSLKDALVSQVEGLATAAGGLSSNVDALKSILSSQLPAIVSKLEESIPALAGLIPKATLQGDMTALIGLISNPSGFATQAAAIVSKYGTVPGVDIAGLASSILSGGISADTICKLIPNVEIDALNNVIKKGIIPVPPTDAVEKLPDVVAQALSALTQSNSLSALTSVVAETRERLDGTIVKELKNVSNADCPGGIMAVLGNQLQTLTGQPIPEEIQKAFTGMPGALTSACASGDLEEKLNKFQEMIRKEMPDPPPAIKDFANNFPVEEMQTKLKEAITDLKDIFPPTTSVA